LEDAWGPQRGTPLHTVSSAAAALLSAREREIAMLAIQGRSNMEIARELSITHKTVEKHLGSAYQKLGVSSRV
jgi:DNA-binding CsgD family transcriptional regulator